MKTFKIKGHIHAQVQGYETESEKGMVSYKTTVMIIKDNWMMVTGLYSATTRKHIGWYLKQVFPWITYQDVKALYESDTKLNVVTGEIVPLTDEDKDYLHDVA